MSFKKETPNTCTTKLFSFENWYSCRLNYVLNLKKYQHLKHIKLRILCFKKFNQKKCCQKWKTKWLRICYSVLSAHTIKSSKHIWKKHIGNVHEGKRKHECSICNARCSGRNLLNQHIQTAHEGKKFKCSIFTPWCWIQ